MTLGLCIIRVDASSLIGNGHLSRCLIIAKYMREKGWKVEFLSCNQQSKHSIEKEGFICKFQGINETYLSHIPSKKMPLVIIADINSEAIFNSTDEYNKYIKMLALQADLLVTFEDLKNYPYPADIVIIPYCGAEKLKLERENTNTKYLLGPSYFLIKDEFHDIKYLINSKVENILITMGGSDPERITLKVLRAINKQKIDAYITVVIGNLSKITNQELNEASGDLMMQVKIKRNVSNLAEIFSKADIAFTNSGLTKYELSAIGVPMIIISNTERQAKHSDVFSESGNSFHLGNHLLVSDRAIVKAYNKLNDDYYERSNMSDKGKSLIRSLSINNIYREIEKGVNF